ncbi:MAG: MFS transporter [Nitrospirae bacterium]|nr:MFS transporter [Nitrospirota bacterium]
MTALAQRSILRDRRLVLAAAFLRALATGLMGVLLGLYLARHGFDAVAIGLVIGSGLSGAATATLIVTFFGDRLGRRFTLVALALLAALGGVALLVTEHLTAVCAVAFLGMVNGAGRDRAAAVAIDQAILPATMGHAGRTRVFAWYNVLQDAGHAVGGLAAALPVVIARLAGITELTGYGWTLGLYAALCLAAGALYLALSPAIEARPNHEGFMPPLAPESRRVIAHISALFAVDSIAGGFLGTALLSYFFFERFGAAEGAIAALFFAARVANGISHLGAAWLAARIGLVNTMVFTHIPSSLMLIAVALAPEFWIAAALFLVRELLVEMDVPTRQSYVMAVVRPEERTFASGVTSLVRLGGWAAAPFFAGFLMQGVALATPLFLGAGMKIAYDILLYQEFRHLKPPEESAGN